MSIIPVLVSAVTLLLVVVAFAFSFWLARTLRGSVFQKGVVYLVLAGALAGFSRSIDLYTGIYGRQEPLDTLGDIALALTSLTLVLGGIGLYRAWNGLSKAAE